MKKKKAGAKPQREKIRKKSGGGDRGAEEEKEEHMLEEIGVLGINWDSVNDTLNIRGPKWGSLPTTKRELLSEVSMTYDPLGFVAPITIRAKMLMQTVWSLGTEVNWEDGVPEPVRDKLSELRAELSDVDKI